jgi:hypothetical protein
MQTRLAMHMNRSLSHSPFCFSIHSTFLWNKKQLLLPAQLKEFCAKKCTAETKAMKPKTLQHFQLWLVHGRVELVEC